MLSLAATDVESRSLLSPCLRGEVFWAVDRRAQTVIDLILTNFHRQLTLDEMAQSVNLTPTHLCRVFKAATGISPAKYLKRIRIEKAQELLETTFLSVKEVIRSVGATDQSHFMRDFKSATGLPLAQYRAFHHRSNLSLNSHGAMSRSASK